MGGSAFGTTYLSQSGGTLTCAGSSRSTTAIGSVSWASGTYEICGTITSPFQVTANNVTIIFDTGAAIDANCQSGTGSACVSATNLSGFLMDGNTSTSGSPCGWIALAQVACNGTVEASNPTQLTGSAFGIDATGCTNCEFRNLNIGPIYNITSGGTQPNGDIRGIQFLPSAGTGTSAVHNNIIHDTSSAIVYVPHGNTDSGLQSYNNYEYNNNSHLDISNDASGIITAAVDHDNFLGATGNWDGGGCPDHHNGMHSFAYSDSRNNSQAYIITGLSESGSTVTFGMQQQLEQLLFRRQLAT
jgi:hypothetical protein